MQQQQSQWAEKTCRLSALSVVCVNYTSNTSPRRTTLLRRAAQWKNICTTWLHTVLWKTIPGFADTAEYISPAPFINLTHQMVCCTGPSGKPSWPVWKGAGALKKHLAGYWMNHLHITVYHGLTSTNQTNEPHDVVVGSQSELRKKSLHCCSLFFLQWRNSPVVI